jgi:hypothetical protein
MNDAHLHLLVNHFPIIGTIFGLGILITGMLLPIFYLLLQQYLQLLAWEQERELKN